MSSDAEIAAEVERLKADFARTDEQSRSFNHFYDPILFKDEKTALCKGHIINQGIPNCSKAWAVQRQDIDNFYGSLVESEFTTLVNAGDITVDKVLADRNLRKRIPWTTFVDGVPCSHYEVGDHVSQFHPTVTLQEKVGALKIALKVSGEELPERARLEIVVDRDYVPEAVASLIKATHLTMFRVFGYQYVFSAAGQSTAEILRTFYLDNKYQPRKVQVAAIRPYFNKYAGMVIPLAGYSNEFVRGSIEDRRFLICVGASGRFFSLGVLVRTNNQMSIVFLPPDQAESMGTYEEFTRERSKPPFHYRLADFVDGRFGEPMHWNVFENDFTFDPDKMPLVTAE